MIRMKRRYFDGSQTALGAIGNAALREMMDGGWDKAESLAYKFDLMV